MLYVKQSFRNKDLVYLLKMLKMLAVLCLNFVSAIAKPMRKKFPLGIVAATQLA